jgi:hypothetical protein
MRTPSKKLKMALWILIPLVLVVGFCFTQFYLIEITGPAYEGDDWGLRPARSGDLALVWTHFFRKSLHKGDLALLESRDPGRKEQIFVRRIDQPPDARTRRFSWVEYRPESSDEMIYQPGADVHIAGRVICIIRMPGVFR